MGFPVRGVIVLGLVARTAHAEPDELKLADVVRVAVRQSPDFERAKLDVAAAGAALLQAEGVEDLHVGASASGNATKLSSQAAFQAQKSQQLAGSVSLTKVLPTGGTIGVTAGSQYLTQDANGMTFKQYTSSVLVRLTHPLLRGAWPGGYEAPIHQAEHARDAAVLAREAKARDDLVAIEQAYWQLAFAWRQLEVRKAALETTKQQQQYTEASIRIGKLPKSDALAVDEVFAVRQQDVLAAEQQVLEQSLALRQLGGLEIEPAHLELKTEVLPAKVGGGTVEVAATVRDAFAHSAELASIEANRHAAEAGVEGADAAARSRLDLDVSGGPVGTDDKSLGTSISNATSGYQVSASLTFDHAIGRHIERGGQEAARTTLSRAKVDERDARAKLAVRAARAVQRLRAAVASIALGDKAVDLAEQAVTAEQNKLELGKTNTFEVLRRQDELQQARLRQASATLDYLSARAEIDGLTGAILGQYGVTMQ